MPRSLCEEAGRKPFADFEVSIFAGPNTREELDHLEEIGVDRVVFFLPPAGADTLEPMLDKLAALIPDRPRGHPWPRSPATSPTLRPTPKFGTTRTHGCSTGPISGVGATATEIWHHPNLRGAHPAQFQQRRAARVRCQVETGRGCWPRCGSAPVPIDAHELT